MKNMKKVFAIVLAMVMILSASLCVFAYNEEETGNYVFKVVADKDSVAVGEDVRLNFYVYDTETGEIVTDSSAISNFVVYYNADILSVKSTAEAASSDSIIGTAIAGEISYWIEGAAITFSESTPFFYVDFTAIEEGTCDFTLEDDGMTSLNDAIFWNEKAEDFDSLFVGASVEVKAAGPIVPDEEVFGIVKTEAAVAGTDTMKDENGADVAAAGDKVVAIFAKNVTDVELEAGSYGIVFGGVRYAGQLAVPANTAWAIKLVGSAEQLPAGSYAYGVFAGDATVDAATPWVID